MVEKNRLGKSDLYVMPLTLGCMSLPLDLNESSKIIDYALDKGINHLDTADLYQFGENEKMIGEIIKHRRENIILTTKVGNHFDSKKQSWYWDPSKEYIQSAVDASLQRLQTDYIDLYLLHGGTSDDPIDETVEAFEQLKQVGKIRAYGISSIRPNVIKEYVRKSKIDAVMMQYNMLDRRPEEFLDDLHENDISVLARGPLAKGMLSNHSEKYIEEKGKDGYLEYTGQELKAINSKFRNENESLNSVALRYVLHHPAVKSAVFGARTVEQLMTNLDSLFLPKLSNDKIQQIKNCTTFFPYSTHR